MGQIRGLSGRTTLRRARCAGVLLLALSFSQAHSTLLYETGFEAHEGFDATQTLAGQGGWVSINSGGNGLVDDFIDGLGRHAFIGFSPPQNPQQPLFLFRPLNHVPDTNTAPVVRFSAVMSVIDSTNGRYDDFRWSIYNRAGHRLFTLDFDNDAMLISYALDDTGGFVSTGIPFEHAFPMELVIQMNFARNHWTASLNGLVVVNAQPITTSGAAADIGDIDAVWSIRNPSAPGDNFMLFDDYRIETMTLDAIRPTLEWQHRLPDGRAVIRIYGEPGRGYAIEGSSDLEVWTLLRNASSPDGVLDVVDDESQGLAQRFYRARLISTE